MIVSKAWRKRLTVLSMFSALILVDAPSRAQGPESFAGRTLIEALHMLQAKGLKIVFTSATVTPRMRVRTEPRSAVPREQLDELLRQHGLKARNGPGGLIQIVREPAAVSKTDTPTGAIEGIVVDAQTAVPLAGAVITIDATTDAQHTDAAGRFVVRHVIAGLRTITASSAGYVRRQRTLRVSEDRTSVMTMELLPAARTHHEHVTVSGARPQRLEPGLPSEASIDRNDLERLLGSLADDPIRSIHAFPGVSAVDDFRSDFTVRGSPFRHVEVVIDGVSTQWLQHTGHGLAATGSLPMFTASALDQATLRTGAYPHRHGDVVGPQLELRLREGSRERFALRGSIGGPNGTLVGEGPIGSARRGSWLVALRQSYLEWPAERPDSTRTPFGFSDGLAKVVYDVRPRQQVGMSVLGGITALDGNDDMTAGGVGDGSNRASLVNLSWRSTLNSRMVVTHRAYLLRQQFMNRRPDGSDSDSGMNEELGYRADVIRRMGAGLLEFGAQVRRTELHDLPQASNPDEALAADAWGRSAYVHFGWAVGPSLSISPGLRITGSTLLPRQTLSRWVLGRWAFRQHWVLNASAGLSYQPPDLNGASRWPAASLDPESAVHLDAGIEHGATPVHWRLVLFRRIENDIVREPDNYPRLVQGVVMPPVRPESTTRLKGRSEGIEFVLGRQSEKRLSGWAAYSFARTRYTDASMDETFWGDFDRRHSLNLFGVYRLSSDSSIGVTFRAGTNFPVPGYLTERDGRLFISDQRNTVRLPPYARLDVRGDRRLPYLGRRFTVFCEVLNVLNRHNTGSADGSINAATGEAVGFTHPLSPRRVSAGVFVVF